MEFLNLNLFQTTTQATVNSGTLTVENMFRRDLSYQFVTAGLNNDATTASLTITLDAATLCSRLAIAGHNLQEFDIFYDGVTANTLALTSTANTTTANYSTNSETAHYFAFTPQTLTSITIDMKSTIVANAEKALGYLHLSDQLLAFARVPSAKDYKPALISKEVAHKMSDGGLRLHYVENKFSAKIKYKFIDADFRDSLFDIWKSKAAFTFVPFGTTTGWTGILHDVVWPGSFDFYRFSDNAQSSGFSGNISLNEVS